MLHRFFGVFFALALCVGCRSVSLPQPAFDEARAEITGNRAECVLIRDGRIVRAYRGRGVSPLLELYDSSRAEMRGAIVVDKVIGRAAAAIAICGRVRHVHGEVMSEDAEAFLRANGITSSHTLLVPRILNRKRDGLCPLEKSVEGISQPEQALAALRRRVTELQAGK